MIAGPVTASPPPKTLGSEVWSVSGFARIVPLRLSSSSPAKDGVFGRSPIARMTRSAATLSRVVGSSWGLNRLSWSNTETHRTKSSPTTVAPSFRTRPTAPGGVDVDSLLLGLLDLPLVGRHLGAGLEAVEVDIGGAEPQRRSARSPWRRCRRPRPRHAAPRRSAGAFALRPWRNSTASSTPSASSPGTASLRPPVLPVERKTASNPESERIDSTRWSSSIATPSAVTFLMSRARSCLGQPVGGDAPAHDPPGLVLRLEDRDRVAVPSEEEGGGEARRAGADDRDRLAVLLRGRPVLGLRVGRVVSVDHEPLDAPNGDGAVDPGPGALLLARSIAGPARDSPVGGHRRGAAGRPPRTFPLVPGRRTRAGGRRRGRCRSTGSSHYA